MPFSIRRLLSALAVLLLTGSGAAEAQPLLSLPPANPGPRAAIGEDYAFEVAFGLWNPTPGIVINSESLGIPGTDVDLVNDLGVMQKRLTRLNATLKTGRHKLRFERVPIQYVASTKLTQPFVFNGQRFAAGTTVDTSAAFKTYRAGYELDIIRADRGYLGILTDVKITDVDVSLTRSLGTEFTSAIAPIPTVGGVLRIYPLPFLAVGGEASYFRIPESLDENYRGRYLDYDVYTTVNATNNIGATLGYRSIDVFYRNRLDTGSLTFAGFYLSGVVRF
ncbi:MAG: hypothetical protein FJW29_11850 [Acidobacteria bacterium]|nr:hypothetical protein [Acidobacteriota bacterium]